MQGGQAPFRWLYLPRTSGGAVNAHALWAGPRESTQQRPSPTSSVLVWTQQFCSVHHTSQSITSSLATCREGPKRKGSSCLSNILEKGEVSILWKRGRFTKRISSTQKQSSRIKTFIRVDCRLARLAIVWLFWCFKMKAFSPVQSPYGGGEKEDISCPGLLSHSYSLDISWINLVLLSLTKNEWMNEVLFNSTNFTEAQGY